MTSLPTSMPRHNSPTCPKVCPRAQHTSLYGGSQGHLASQGPASSPETYTDINKALPAAPRPSFQLPGPPDLSEQLQPACRAVKAAAISDYTLNTALSHLGRLNFPILGGNKDARPLSYLLS